MLKFEILQYPHPFLKTKAKSVPLENIDDAFREKISYMFTLMYNSQGGGLAAVQVGLDERFFIMDASEDHNEKIIAINPVIVDKQGEVIEEEGCLSFPGVSAKVKRFETITMQAYDAFGEQYTMEAEGYLSRCIQHELDHLNGITYFDHLSPLKRSMIEKKYKKLMDINTKS